MSASNLFEDDFEDELITSNKWVVVGDPGWSVDSGKYRVSLSPGLSNTTPSNSVWDLNWTNIRYELDLVGVAGVDRNILIKFVDPSNFLEFHANDRGMILEKGSTITGSQVLDQDSQLLQNGVNYHFRIDVKNNNEIKVYINDILRLEGIENNPLTNWRVGLRAGSGGIGTVDVSYDNVVVTELIEATSTPTSSPSPTPTTEPTASPTATASATPISTSGPFELPFSYPNRLNSTDQEFKDAFWSKMTAIFDHVFLINFVRPFTGDTFVPPCTIPLTCYDTHNGTDFAKSGTDGFAYSVGTGKVVYTSKPEDNCTSHTSGYGCSVIVRHSGNLYGLYAHLSEILVYESQDVFNTTKIGVMGHTGSATGDHLHLGILKPINDKLTSTSVTFMKNKDWKNLLEQSSTANKLPRFKPYCTYKAPNGAVFSFQDPSGWFGPDKDPWSLPKSKDGCGITSPYLWKFNIL